MKDISSVLFCKSNFNSLKKKGHNGLVAANYLAKYSKKKLKICLLEKRHVIGGAAVTEELVPGFKFSRASYLLSLFRPVILKDLGNLTDQIIYFNPKVY